MIRRSFPRFLIVIVTPAFSVIIAAVMVAQPAQTRAVGVIEGIVTQTDTGAPVANAQVTLSGGPIKSQSLNKLSEQLAESTYMPGDAAMVGIRGQYVNSGAMAQPAAQQAAIKEMSEGLPAGPQTAAMEDGILQNIMRYSNVNFGTSPFNSEFVSA